MHSIAISTRTHRWHVDARFALYGVTTAPEMDDRTVKTTLKSLVLKAYPLIARIWPSFYYPYRFRGGRIYLDITESRMMLARAIGAYEAEKHEVLRGILKPGGVFVDAGANKGDFSLAAARVVGVAGSVLTFEPEPTNCAWIRKSVELNGYSNVAIYEVALSDENGEARLFIGEKSGWHSLLRRRESLNRNSISVQTRTLDSILEDLGVSDRIDVIKIDVEGAELPVLRGASRTISRNDGLVVLMDIHPQLGVNPQEVCGFLEERGFRIFEVRSPLAERVVARSNLSSLMARRV